ncbi:MAG TPA: aminopeptidase P N-terminal domain-containing protein, partial [Bacteroidota bacterium]
MRRIRTICSSAVLFVLTALVSVAQDVKYIEYDTDLIAPSVYKARREKLMQDIGSDAAAVFYSAPVRSRNWDVEYLYRQDDNFYYLTGFTEPNSILVLAPKGVSVRSMDDSTKMVTVEELLFVQSRDPQSETWEGRRYGPAGAMKLRGIEYAVTNDKFESMLGAVFSFQSRPR